MSGRLNNRSNFNSKGYDVDVGTPLVYKANATRDYFLVYNKSNTSVQLRFGPDSTDADSMDIPPNSYYEPLLVPTNTFTITSTSPARVVIFSSDPDSKV